MYWDTAPSTARDFEGVKMNGLGEGAGRMYRCSYDNDHYAWRLETVEVAIDGLEKDNEL